jgi:hypothetical protein
MQYNFMQKNGNKGIKNTNPHASNKNSAPVQSLAMKCSLRFSTGDLCPPGLLMSGWAWISVGFANEVVQIDLPICR